MSIKLLSIMTLIAVQACAIEAAAATWTGLGADPNWTTAENWVGDQAPAPGDALIFPAGPAQRNTVNDFPAGTEFDSIRFVAASKQEYWVAGNDIVLNEGIIDMSVRADWLERQFGFGNNMSIGIKLGRDQSWFIGPDNEGLYLRGRIDLGGHVLTLRDIDLCDDEGCPSVGQIRGMTGISGSVIGQGSIIIARQDLWLRPLRPSSFSGQIVSLNGFLTAGPFAFGTADGTVGNGTVLGNWSTLYVQNDESREHITLKGGDVFGVGTVGPVIAQTKGAGRFSKVGAVLWTDGSYPYWYAGTLAIQGDFHLEDGCTMYSRIEALAQSRVEVRGEVSLDGARLELDNFLDYAPSGSEFILIQNDGNDPVIGTFKDLPEGAILDDQPSHTLFIISYAGGDGNDVTLLAL